MRRYFVLFVVLFAPLAVVGQSSSAQSIDDLSFQIEQLREQQLDRENASRPMTQPVYRKAPNTTADNSVRLTLPLNTPAGFGLAPYPTIHDLNSICLIGEKRIPNRPTVNEMLDIETAKLACEMFIRTTAESWILHIADRDYAPVSAEELQQMLAGYETQYPKDSTKDFAIPALNAFLTASYDSYQKRKKQPSPR